MKGRPKDEGWDQGPTTATITQGLPPTAKQESKSPKGHAGHGPEKYGLRERERERERERAHKCKIQLENS